MEDQPQLEWKGRRALGRRQPIIDDSDEESDGIPVPEGRARAKTKNAAHPLFLDSDNDKAEPDGSDGYASTLKSTGGRSQKREVPKPLPKTKTKRAAAAVVDDDSDDGAVFKGFKGKKKGR